MSVLRLLVRLVFGNYEAFRLFSVDTDSVLATTDTASNGGQIEYRIQERTSDGYHFTASIGDAIVARCSVWTREKHRRERNYWSLAPNEGELVLLETEVAFRGRGLAPRLISYATAEMGARGLKRLYARLWHSNRLSVRTFEKAGWSQIALVFDLYPFGMKRRVRYTKRKR